MWKAKWELVKWMRGTLSVFSLVVSLPSWIIAKSTDFLARLPLFRRKRASEREAAAATTSPAWNEVEEVFFIRVEFSAVEDRPLSGDDTAGRSESANTLSLSKALSKERKSRMIAEAKINFVPPRRLDLFLNKEASFPSFLSYDSTRYCVRVKLVCTDLEIKGKLFSTQETKQIWLQSHFRSRSGSFLSFFLYSRLQLQAASGKEEEKKKDNFPNVLDGLSRSVDEIIPLAAFFARVAREKKRAKIFRWRRKLFFPFLPLCRSADKKTASSLAIYTSKRERSLPELLRYASRE